MAILKGFPPSHSVSNSINVTPPPECIDKGSAIVIDVRDPRRQSRVMLDFGSWALASPPGVGITFEIPSVGTKVTWTAWKGLHGTFLTYWWKEWAKELR